MVSTRKKLFEKFVAMLLIAATILSYFPASVFAEDETNNEESQYVQFTANWADGGTAITTEDNIMKNIQFNISLSGGPVFNNLAIYAEDITENKNLPTPYISFNKMDYTKVSGDGKSLIYDRSMNSGYSANGNLNLMFGGTNDFSEYDKTIQLTLVGESKLNGETTQINEVRTFTVHVVPQPIIKEFSSDVTNKLSLKNKNTAMRTSATNWSLSGFSMLTTIDVDSKNETYSNIKLYIDRTTEQDIAKSVLNNATNLSIEVTKDAGYTYNVVRDEDGTTYVEFTRGEQLDSFDENTTKYRAASIEVKFTYRVAEDTTQLGTGSTLVKTNVVADVEGVSTEYSKNGIEYTKGNYSYNVGKEYSLNLWSKNEGSSYSNDYDTWITGYDRSESEIIEDAKDGNISLTFSSKADGYIQVNEEPQNCRLFIYNYNRNNGGRAFLLYKWVDSSGEVIYQGKYNLSNNEMTLKKIKMTYFDMRKTDKVEFYKIDDDVNTATPFFTATSSDDEYIVPEGEELEEYYAVVTGYHGSYYIDYITLATWDSEWNINLNKVPISEKDITGIGRYQHGEYYQYSKSKIDGSESISSRPISSDSQGCATVNISHSKKNYYVSYASLGLENYNGDASTFGQLEKGKKININFPTEEEIAEGTRIIRNENAKFYIQLPNEYEYSNFKVALRGNTEGTLYLKEYHTENIGGFQYLVVQLDGIYQGDMMRNVGLTVTHDRRLKTQDVPESLPINVYMLTDNAHYLGTTQVNSNQFENSNGTIPAVVMMQSQNFFISESNYILAKTLIYDIRGVGQQPGEDENGNLRISSKNRPLVFEGNQDVTYRSQIEVKEDTLNNVDFMIRLPKENNTPISTSLYTLDSDMSLELTNFENIEVIKQVNRRTKQKVSNTDYQLLYSTEENATYNSSFQVLDENTDLSTVKTIRVKFNPDYTITNGQAIYVNYKMKMPAVTVESTENQKKSAATTAVRYTVLNETDEKILESTPAYVATGNPKSDIVLQKKFQGVQEGNLPEGVTSLAGIQFKLINANTQQPLVLTGQTTAEGVFSTDETGKVTLTDVPEGLYIVEELTEFDYYDGIDYTDVLVEQGTTTPSPVEVVNKRKRADLIINKTWEDTNTQPYNDNDVIKFKITGQGEEPFTVEKRLDKETGTVTFHGVPYGTYTIEETQGLYGWYLANENLTVDVLQPEVTFEAENKIVKGTLVIEKMMPAEDDVRDVTLQITGRGINYVNKNDEEVKLDTDLKLKIRDYCDNTDENIRVDLNDSTKPTKATITISNLPAATYKVEEVDIPKIEDTQIEMYKKPSIKRATISENGEIARASLTNNWKTGNLKIVKTAAPGVDLTQFKVVVKLLNSPYLATYEKTFDIPANGELTIPDLYLGTYSVKEIESDYYIAKYGRGEQQSTDPITTEILDGQTSEAYIYNESTYGYVKIIKTLEDREIDATDKIKFKITGKDAVGNDVTELDDQGNSVNGMTREIEIKTDEVTNKKYGEAIFGPLQAGGEYQLEEVNTPEFYRDMEPIKIDIKKKDIYQDPQVIEIDNKRQRGNLEITTKTVPEGGELTPIRYEVREIKLNDDFSFTQGKVVAELDGVAGFAELNNIYAGKYLVKQTRVPDHYIMDYPQIVEVPDKGTGYAEFEIEKPELKKTNVTIEKEVRTTTGRLAVADDFTAAGLSSDEIFEVRITNVDTQTTYFTFMDIQTPGRIKGLPAGTYEIEEVYKPKYLSSAYLIKNGEDYTEIEKTNGKVLFNVTEPLGDEGSEVTLKIRNVINTGFGFAGQDSKSNFSKTTIAEANKVSKTIINIIDEDGNAVTGAQFKIYYEDGREVPISFEGNTYVIGNDKRFIINGLPKGKYVIKAISLPEGYLPVEDKEFVAYDNASVVTRIEVLKNKPRGNLTLSTTYTDDNGNKAFAPRSKYKILNPKTGEVLKFEKTASGDYIRSKQNSATDTISLRAGSVTVKGIEVGDYQVGLVDLTEQYGVVRESVENVTIVENSTVSREVPVEKRGAFKKVIKNGHRHVCALTENGKVYVCGGYDSYIDEHAKDNELTEISEVYPNLAGMKFIDIGSTGSTGSTCNVLCLVDENGKVWTNDYEFNKSAANKNQMVCINDMEGNPLQNVTIAKVFGNDYYTMMCAIDNSGNIWEWGKIGGSFSAVQGPILFSSNNVLEGKNIVQISSDSLTLAVDSSGDLYAWGYNYANVAGLGNDDGSGKTLEPICVTSSEGSNLNGKKIKKVANTYDASYFIDVNNDLYVCGWNHNGALGINSTDNNQEILNPYCLTGDNTNPLYNKKIIDVSAENEKVMVVDNDGKIWAWGSPYNEYGFGEENHDVKYEPFCISDNINIKLNTVKVKSVEAGNRNDGYAIDENGDLWVWGDYDKPIGRNGEIPPERLNFTQTSYFDLFDVKNVKIVGNHSSLLDNSGRLWTDDGTTDYLSTEYGADLENITIKDYAYYGNGRLSDNYGAVIDAENRVWTFGPINQPYAYKGITNKGADYDKDARPICLTECEDCVLYNKEIQYVAVGNGVQSNSCMAVIDKDGKLYTAGGKNARNLGYAPGTETYNKSIVPFECLNEKYNNLSGVRFTKVCIYGEYTMIALDTEGNLWSWGDKNYSSLGVIPTLYYQADGVDCVVPTKLSIDAKIVDMQIHSYSGIAVDENGKVYIWGSNGLYSIYPSQTPTLVDSDTTPIYGKKIVKVGIGYGYYMLMDENGEVFIDGYNPDITSCSLVKSAGIVARDFYNGENIIVIRDTEDNLWYVGQGSALGYSKTSKTPELLTGVTENPLYNANIVKVIDNIIIVQKGEKQVAYTVNDGTLSDGIVLKQFESYIDPSNSDRTYYMCIDENNNFYIKNYYHKDFYKVTTAEKILCVGLNHAIIKDLRGRLYRTTETSGSMSGWPFTWINGVAGDKAWAVTLNASSNSSSPYVYLEFIQKSDNSLLVRKYGTGSFTTNNAKMLGIANSTTSSTGGDIVGYTGSEIIDMYMSSSSNSVYCIDSDNKLWAWGASYIGNNTANGSETPVVVMNNAKKILASGYSYDMGGYYTYVLDKDNNLWAWGNAAIGNGETTGSLVPVKVLSNVKDVQESRYGIYALDNSGNLWTWGYNRYGNLGTAATPSDYKIYTPINLVEQAGIDPIKEFKVFNSFNVDAISTTGKLYGWGYRNSAWKTPTVIDGNVGLNAHFEDNYLVKDNGVKYSLPDTLTIKEQTGYIVKPDGKIYYHTSSDDYVFNGEQYVYGPLVKKFVLIKDSKYNN